MQVHAELQMLDIDSFQHGMEMSLIGKPVGGVSELTLP
jgi:hypothetical protein